MAMRRPRGARIAAALGLCLCATAALARDAAQDAKRGDGQYQEKQGHMLLLNGAQQQVQVPRQRPKPGTHRAVFLGSSADGGARRVAQATRT